MRPRRAPVGLGSYEIPYDQSEGMMPGMEVPTPQGTMKKMQFEFTDPSEQQQPAIPEGAGVPPAGAQAIPPAGMQGAAPQASPQGAPPEAAGGLFAGLADGADQFGAGPDSSMFSDDQLAAMLEDEDPTEMMGADLHDQLMSPDLPPQTQQELQMRMMEAARRAGGF